MTRARDLARFANNQALSVDGDFDVGINSTTPAAKLDVRGNSVITGILTATSFSGNVTGDATGLSGTPDITVNNIVAAGATFSGVLTYEDVTNVDSVGVITARSGIVVSSGGVTAVGIVSSTEFLHVVGDGGTSGKGIEARSSSTQATDTNKAIRVRNNSDTDTFSLSYRGAATFGGDLTIPDKIIHSGDTNTAIRFPAADTFTVETSGSERLRILANGLIGIGTDDPDNFNGNADDLVIFGTGHQGLTIRSGTSHDGSIMFNDTNDANQRGIIRYLHTDDSMAFHTSGGEALRIDSSGNVGINSSVPAAKLDVRGDSFITGILTATSFSDSIGDVRSIPLNTQSSSASYTLQASDAGKTVHVHTTTTTVVVPNSVFSAGDAVSIVNGDGSNTPTISQGSGFSLRNTGDGSTGNRTLGVFGMATIYFTGAGVGYISGSGMT